MTRKISIGLYLTAISAIAGLVGLIAYVMNCGTSYFSKLGMSPLVVSLLAVAVLLELVVIVVGLKGTPMWADILPIGSTVLLMLGAIQLLSIRVNGIAAVMTFENNASNMADMTSAIVAIAACLIAGIVSIIASFFDITKEA